MYPSATKSKSALKKLSTMLKKPIFDRYAKETETEKWNRMASLIAGILRTTSEEL